MNLYPSLTILLLFACLVAYEYIKSLKTDLKIARSERDNYKRAYINTDRELRDLKGLPTPANYYGTEAPEREAREEPETAEGFTPRGIGPTAIIDRERRREQSDARDREPRFAHPGVLGGRAPSSDEIARAARAAADGDNLN